MLIAARNGFAVSSRIIQPTTFAELADFMSTMHSAQKAEQILIPSAEGVCEIPDVWTATNGTKYNAAKIVVGVGQFEDGNGVMHLGALLQTKWATAETQMFDEKEGVECNSATELVAEEGMSYYGLAQGATSVTAANLTLLSLSVGDTLPYADYEKIYKDSVRDTSRSIFVYGYNNYRDSALRQWLNSSAGAAQWWSSTHVGDVAPSGNSYALRRGYKAGCSTALLNAAKTVKIKTWPNYITDGVDSTSTVYETLDTFFPPSASEVYGAANMSGGQPVEGLLSRYWMLRTGLTAPSDAAISSRVIYQQPLDGSTSATTAVNGHLRSCYRSYSYTVLHVSGNGSIPPYGYTASRASHPYQSLVSCVVY